MDFVSEQQWPLNQEELMDDSFANGSSGIEPELLMPVWAYQSAAAYLIFISVMGLITNIIVAAVILNDSQRMTPLNWMLLNLACSDGTIAGFGTTVSTAAALQFGWPFGQELCVAYAMIMSTAGIGSITTLTALALWRCQLVVYCPAKRSSTFANNSNGGRLGHCQAVLLLATIWTYSLAVTCPPLFGWGRYDREAAHISCSVNWESKMDNNRSYILYMFALGLFVPLVVIIVSYVSILRVVKKTSKFRRTTMATLQQKQEKDQQIKAQLQEMIQQPNLNHNQQKNCKNNNSDVAEKRVTVMVACMVGAFMTAWTPYSILALAETFIGDTNNYSNVSSSQVNANGNAVYYSSAISPAFATIPSLFAKTSAVLNPLIYGLLNTQFRSAWEKFLLRFLGRYRRQNQFSQEAMGVSVNATGRRLRQLLDFSITMKPSLTVNLPMTEIVPILNNDSHPATQYRSTSFRIVDAPIGTQILPQSQSAIKQGRKVEESLKNYRSGMNSVGNRVVTNKPSKCVQRNPTQHEQPVKLVVVRLLSDSTSCCYTTEETSFDASSSPARRSSIKNRLNKSKNNLPQQV